MRSARDRCPAPVRTFERAGKRWSCEGRVRVERVSVLRSSASLHQSESAVRFVSVGAVQWEVPGTVLHLQGSRHPAGPGTADVGLLRRLKHRGGGQAARHDGVVVGQVGIEGAYVGAHGGRVTGDPTQCLHLGILRVERSRHAGGDGLMVHLVRRAPGELGAAVAVRGRARRRAKVVAEMDIQLPGVGVLLRRRFVGRFVRGELVGAVDIQVRKTSVQGRRRYVGVRQGVHGSQILCRNVATERAERSPRATARARCAVAIGIHLAIQLVHLVLAVERGRLVGGEFIGSSATGRGVLIAQVVVLVDSDVG